MNAPDAAELYQISLWHIETDLANLHNFSKLLNAVTIDEVEHDALILEHIAVSLQQQQVTILNFLLFLDEIADIVEGILVHVVDTDSNDEIRYGLQFDRIQLYLQSQITLILTMWPALCFDL